MLTGDHPATARAIAHEAGLLDGQGEVLTGDEIAALENDELDRRLEQVAVIARVTPLDKLRIVESLQRRGHTVAMTGDGVNDAPALRLADVGVAMGKRRDGGRAPGGGRRARGRRLRDACGGAGRGPQFLAQYPPRPRACCSAGNLGELGLVVGATAMGFPAPLITRQILAVNLITDALPALSVALQGPETRNLASLAREGTAALDAPLRRDIIRRGLATALPALGAFILALGVSALPQARTVAFASIVATQLAQTLDAGHAEGTLTRPVLRRRHRLCRVARRRPDHCAAPHPARPHRDDAARVVSRRPLARRIAVVVESGFRVRACAEHRVSRRHTYLPLPRVRLA